MWPGRVSLYSGETGLAGRRYGRRFWEPADRDGREGAASMARKTGWSVMTEKGVNAE